MKFIKWLADIDRRIIFALIALSIIIPTIVPMGLPVKPTKNVIDIYDDINALPEGSVVLLSFDYDPAAAPECHPMAKAIIRHCLEKEHKIIAMALWPQGAALATQALTDVTTDYEVVYGVDYINLGYKAGAEILLNTMGTSIPEAFPRDINGNSISEFPLTKGLKNYSDIDYIVDLSAGDPGIRTWVTVVQARFGKPVAAGCTAVSAPEFFPYVQSGQLQGLIAGLKGAAEYEALIKYPDEATGRMDAQSIAHLVIIMFIIFANVSFFILRKEKKEEEKEAMK